MAVWSLGRLPRGLNMVQDFQLRMVLEDAMAEQLPRLTDRRALSHLLHGLGFLNITFSSLPDPLRLELLGCVERAARGLAHSLPDAYGVVAGLSGIGVTKADLTEATTQVLFTVAVQMLAQPEKFRFVDRFVTNLFSADDYASALQQLKKRPHDRTAVATTSCEDDIYL
jgi:hypothetical protein